MFRSSFKAMLTCVCAVALLCSSTASFGQDDQKQSDMLDQVTLSDGRQFSGNIIEETADSITMEIIKMGMRTKQTWPRKDILEVLHDAIPNTDVKKDADADATGDQGTKSNALYDPNDPRQRVYKVPIRGPVGTDAHMQIIQMIWNEAIEAHAQTIILEFDCNQDFGRPDLQEYRNFFEKLKRDARSKEIHVVVWVKQAKGVALAYALMFPEIYFQPDGEMGGGGAISESLSEQFKDQAVRAKMISAWTGICRGMAEEGNHDQLLCQAMIRPEMVLSMTLEGDKPHFYDDVTSGQTVLDSRDGDKPEDALQLTAQDAAKYGISGGTYRSIDDLMLQLGYREYNYIEGHAEDFATKWADGWKDAMEEYRYIRADIDLIDTYNEPIDRKIAKKISKLREIQALMKKWPPMEVYINPEQIYFEIDTYKKELRNINNGNNGNNGGGSSGSGRGKDPGN